jgi:hypothetical protein
MIFREVLALERDRQLRGRLSREAWFDTGAAGMRCSTCPESGISVVRHQGPGYSILPSFSYCIDLNNDTSFYR